MAIRVGPDKALASQGKDSGQKPQAQQAQQARQQAANAARQASERRDREDDDADDRQRRAASSQADDGGEWEPDPDEDMDLDDLGAESETPADTRDELTDMASGTLEDATRERNKYDVAAQEREEDIEDATRERNKYDVAAQEREEDIEDATRERNKYDVAARERDSDDDSGASGDISGGAADDIGSWGMGTADDDGAGDGGDILSGGAPGPTQPQTQPLSTEELLDLHRRAMNSPGVTPGDRAWLSHMIQRGESGGLPETAYLGAARFDAEREYRRGGNMPGAGVTAAEYGGAFGSWDGARRQREREGWAAQQPPARFAAEQAFYDGEIAYDRYEIGFEAWAAEQQREHEDRERRRVEDGGLTANDLADQGAGGYADGLRRFEAPTPALDVAPGAVGRSSDDGPWGFAAPAAEPEPERTWEPHEWDQDYGFGGPNDYEVAADAPVDAFGGSDLPGFGLQADAPETQADAPETFAERRRRLLRERFDTAPTFGGLTESAAGLGVGALKQAGSNLRSDIEQRALEAGVVLAKPHELYWAASDRITGERSDANPVTRSFDAFPSTGELLTGSGGVGGRALASVLPGAVHDMPGLSWVPGQDLARAGVDGKIRGGEWLTVGAAPLEVLPLPYGKAAGVTVKGVKHAARGGADLFRRIRRPTDALRQKQVLDDLSGFVDIKDAKGPYRPDPIHWQTPEGPKPGGGGAFKVTRDPNTGEPVFSVSKDGWNWPTVDPSPSHVPSVNMVTRESGLVAPQGGGVATATNPFRPPALQPGWEVPPVRPPHMPPGFSPEVPLPTSPARGFPSILPVPSPAEAPGEAEWLAPDTWTETAPESEAEPGTETAPGTSTEPDQDTAPAPGPQPEQQPQPEPEVPGPGPQPEPEVPGPGPAPASPVPRPTPEPRTAPGLLPAAWLSPGPRVGQQGRTQQRSEPIPQPQPAPEPEPQPQPAPEPEPDLLRQQQQARLDAGAAVAARMRAAQVARSTKPRPRVPKERDGGEPLPRIEAAPRPPGSYPRMVAHEEVVEYGYNPDTDTFTARTVRTSEPSVIKWDDTPPDGGGRDVGAWEIIPTRQGVVAEARVTDREIAVPLGVKATLREQARRAGGQPVAQQRRMRVDHDLDTRTTDAELVRTAKARAKVAEAVKAESKGVNRRASRRQDKKLKRGPLGYPDIQIDLKSSPTTAGGW